MANDDLRRIKQRIATVSLERVAPIAELYLSDGEKYLHDGEVKLNEVQTDPIDRYRFYSGEFSNPDIFLLPGYVRQS